MLALSQQDSFERARMAVLCVLMGECLVRRIEMRTFNYTSSQGDSVWGLEAHMLGARRMQG